MVVNWSSHDWNREWNILISQLLYKKVNYIYKKYINVFKIGLYKWTKHEWIIELMLSSLLWSFNTCPVVIEFIDDLVSNIRRDSNFFNSWDH